MVIPRLLRELPLSPLSFVSQREATNFNTRIFRIHCILGFLMIQDSEQGICNISCRISKIDDTRSRYEIAWSKNTVSTRLRVFHLRPKTVSYNTRPSADKGRCFLYEGRKFEYTNIRHKAKQNVTKPAKLLVIKCFFISFFLLAFR